MSAAAMARLFNANWVPKGAGFSPLWNHCHVRAAVRREQTRRDAALLAQPDLLYIM